MTKSNLSLFAPLEKILCVERDPALIIGFSNTETLTWRQWRTRVEQWRHEISSRVEQRFALFHNDALEFSAILFALWAENKIAVVPANAQPVTVDLLQPSVDAFIGEFETQNLSSKPLLSVDDALVPTLLSTQNTELNINDLVLEVFTSGSSGEPVAIPKLLSQLSNEVSNLQLLWGDLIEEARLFATVSHHHIYGLLFRVLWPLAAGKPFSADICEFLEDLTTLSDSSDVVVISSPTHLSRLPQLNDWGSLQSRCKGIFSSGAPLPRTASLETQQLLAIAPIEVFGSSETGGIAWRQQSPIEDTLWQLIPGIKISINENSKNLQIQSPYLASNDWYVTSDQIKLEDEKHFRLLGRVDRIVKVEGKRLSLSEMERRIQLHDYVELARVIVLERKRTTVCAAVILNSLGEQQLQEQGKRALNTLLSQYVFEQFERPVLPRRWRYPKALPKDTQGKVLHSSLVALFSEQSTEGESPKRNLSSAPKFPEIVSMERVDQSVILMLKIIEDLLYFDGHFDDVAILPGVVQVHWAEHYGRQYCTEQDSNGNTIGFVGEFSHLEAIKFQHVIRANAIVRLSLNYVAGKGKLHFRFESDKGNHSSGRIAIQQADDANKEPE